MVRYSIDKAGRPDSDNDNPAGENCSTPELRNQAWTNRAQQLVNAKDTCSIAAKWGVKTLEKGEDGKQEWI